MKWVDFFMREMRNSHWPKYCQVISDRFIQLHSFLANMLISFCADLISYEFVQSTRSSDELIENILAFEKYLAENNDVGCYTVGSAVSWKKGK